MAAVNVHLADGCDARELLAHAQRCLTREGKQHVIAIDVPVGLACAEVVW